MIRRNPVYTLDIPGYLNFNPEKKPGFFVESKQQNDLFAKPPNWDSAGDSIELIAAENDLELKTLRLLQNEMLEDAEHQREINADRVAEINSLQKHLRSQFAAVNMNLKLCDDKKIKAAHRVAKEKAKHDQLKALITKYVNDIEALTQFRKKLSKTVKDLEPYETGINEVVAQTDAFASVKDCTDRCDALMLVQTEINQMKKVKLPEIEFKRQEMVRLSKEAALTVLGFLNELSQLERDFYTALHACAMWEKALSNIKDCIIENNLAKYRMLDGIRLMHRDLCLRRKITPLTVPLEEQLDFIREEILILQHVVVECNKSKA